MADQPEPPRTLRDPKYSRVVLLTLGAWIAIHALLLAAIGLPGYADCQGTTRSPTVFLGCGLSLGLIALAIGWIQPFYGVVIALLIRKRRTAVAQGIFIGVGIVTLLFTVLCFGSAFGA